MSKKWKANNGRTDGRTTDNRPWHKLTWNKAPGELKIHTMKAESKYLTKKNKKNKKQKKKKQKKTFHEI